MDAKQTSPWIAAGIASVVTLAMALGVADMQQRDATARLLTQLDIIKSSISDVGNRVMALEEQTKTLADAKPDSAPINAVNAQLTALNEQLTALSTRMETLESKPAPAPAPVVAAPAAATPLTPAPDQLEPLRLVVQSGEPYEVALEIWEQAHGPAPAALKKFNATGIPTTEKLRAAFMAAIPPVAAAAETPGTLQKINERMKGFVSIKKTGDADSYDALRKLPASADVETMKVAVLALPEPARAPFVDWLGQVKSREEAISALATLNPAKH